jgi:hypothetical protein
MTFDRDDTIQTIADHVGELVKPRRHVEPYYVWTTGRNRKMHAHTTDQPSLLDQLRALIDAPLVTERGDSGRSVPKSRSPLGEDALDRLMAIEAGSAWWATVRLRHDLRDTVEDNLRLLAGAATRMDDPDLRDLGYDVRRFHGWAATLTGWQTAPWRPRAACPCATGRGRCGCCWTSGARRVWAAVRCGRRTTGRSGCSRTTSGSSGSATRRRRGWRRQLDGLSESYEDPGWERSVHARPL